MSWGMGARDHMWVGRENGDFRSSWNWKRLHAIPTLTSYHRNLGQDHAPFPVQRSWATMPLPPVQSVL